MKAATDSANLDFLRTVAVLCVVLAHVTHFVTGETSEFAWHLGQSGVLMFFVHTSLVLMMSLQRAKLPGAKLFGFFYTRRAFRIYPLSMVCVLIVYFTHYRPEVDLVWRAWTLKELFANLTLTENLTYSNDFIGVLWSLPLEVQMYIFLPFLFLWFRKRPISWLLALWVGAVLIGIVQPRFAGRLNVFGYAPCFIPGIIAWRLLSPRRERLPGWLWPAAILAVSPVWFAASREHDMYYRWVFCLLLGLVIPFFSEIPFKWLGKTAKIVAKYSYGIYLSHQWSLTVGFILLRHSSLTVQWAVFLLMGMGLPFLMYHLIEHPGIVLGQQVASHWFKPRTASTEELVNVAVP